MRYNLIAFYSLDELLVHLKSLNHRQFSIKPSTLKWKVHDRIEYNFLNNNY